MDNESGLYNLLIRRHQTPWNWLIQVISLIVFCMSLWFRSYLLFATSMIGFGASMFEIHLAPLECRPVKLAIRGERKWLRKPWNMAKYIQAFLIILYLAILGWALVVGELAVVGMAMGVIALLRAIFQNRSGGVDP